jgi:creatinine amidohydrolase
MSQNPMNKVVRPIEQGDWNLAYMFPHEIAEARQRTGLVLLPLAPVEWHGPHLTMGCDPLLAHAFARRLAAELRCPYYPPVFLGTERERTPDSLESIGFERNLYIEGMDFPNNSVASAYIREEVFALVVRNLLDILLNRMHFRKVVIVNGHGADNQIGTLERICREFNGLSAGGERARWIFAGFAHTAGGAIGHATSDEASMLAAAWPGCVDISRLPASGPLKNIDHAVVDGETFENKPTPDHSVRPNQDPRYHTDPVKGEEQLAHAAELELAEIRKWLAAM